MNYQAGGEGTIIDSGEESFAGDELQDNINDGEMVLNLDQQDEMVSLLQELAERRRGDEMVDAGEASVNEPQQEALMAVARGEAQPEEVLDPNASIVEENGASTASDLEALLSQLEGNAYADGGYNPLDALQGLGLPEYGTQAPMLPAGEIAQLDQQAEEAELLNALGQQEVASGQEEEADFLNNLGQQEVDEAQVYDSEPIDIKADPEKEIDSELNKAKTKDTVLNLLNDINKGLSHMDAANPNAMLRPVKTHEQKTDFEKSLVKAREMASSKADRKQKAADEKKFKEDTLKVKQDQLKINQEKAGISATKAESKEIRKENKELEGNLDAVRKQKQNIQTAMDALKDAELGVTDTGPMDQYASRMTDKGQELEQKLNTLALDKMVKMFSGMSKAIDSDAERDFFMKAQPNMSNYSSVNKKILEGMLKNANNLEKKLQTKLGSNTAPKETNTDEYEYKTVNGKLLRRKK
jgi:hypothetical protein